MLIDIQIRDATPEELRDLFGKKEYTTPDDHALLPMPVFDKLLKEYKEPKSREIIEKTFNPPHEPMVPDHREENLARAVIPSDELPKEPVKKKQGGSHGKGNKYGIPSELRKTDKKRYDVLWARCNQHGIMYEEAVKRDGIKGGRTGRTATPKKSEHTTGITGQPQSEEKLSVTESRIDKPPSDIKTIPLKVDLSDTFKLGTHVKQIKKFHDRQVSGIGIVTAHKNGLVEVNFSGSQYCKIAPECLEVV